MYKMVLSATDIANKNQHFVCGADLLLSILQMIKELKRYQIEVTELDGGGIEIQVGSSVYNVERDF